MRIKAMLVATSVATVLAPVAMPGVAAGDSVDYPGEGHFEVMSEGKLVWKLGSITIQCEKVTGHGTFKDQHSGSIQLLIHDCTSKGTKCRSAGQLSGTIETTTLPFHVVKIAHSGEERSGVLITTGEDEEGNSHFATFACAFGLLSVKVTGSGLIGTLSSPNCEEQSSEFTFSLQEDGEGSQTHTTAHDTTELVDPETHYRLTGKIGSGESTPFVLIGNEVLSFIEGEATLTCAEA